MVLNLKQKPINEVYIGKTKDLLAMEDQIGKFRNKYMGKYIYSYKVNNDPDLLLFNRMVEKYFGFGCFSMTIKQQPIVNAATYIIDYRIDIDNMNLKNDLMVDKRSLKFNPDKDYAVITFFYSGIMFNPVYTNGEIIAILLHEIGHNFANAMSHNAALLAYVYKTMNIVTSIITSPITAVIRYAIGSNKVIGTFAKMENRSREIDGIYSNISNIYDFIIDIYGTIQIYVYDIISVLTGLNVYKYLYSIGYLALRIIRNPFGAWLSTSSVYASERIADNFVTMYGYGSEFSSALDKLELKENDPSIIIKAFNSIPFISALSNMMALPADIFMNGFNPHPQHIARVRDQLDFLERETKKEDLDPKMKKVILKDIQDINKSYNRMIDTSKGIKDPNIGRHLYYKFLHDATGDKAIKDILLDDKDKFERYDQAYNYAMKRR